MDDALLVGEGRLFTNPDPDLLRAHQARKSRGLVPKVTTVAEAVARYVPEGAYVAVGGFGQTRIPTALLHEIVRQGRRHLGLSGHTATHDFQILTAGRCFDRCDVAYIVGLEMRGLSPAARRYCESGEVELCEWTNAALLWRYRAAAMGVSFLPSRSMLGTDTFRYSAARQIRCPFTGGRYAALPALSPDVTLVHVHRADVYGNCQIDGSTVADLEAAAAARHVVVTCERLINNREIRSHPERTFLPWYLVDAVIEVPFGCYPGNMPGEYFSDEEHLAEWLEVEKDPATFESFVDRNIRKTRDFQEYLDLRGGMERLIRLRHEELLIDREGEDE
ncbi:MAG: CoA transferase subunit A [Deltaproteobacteria bacterium]|nr:CoA transferase subunit A [Deltaproteobacteria bacterium]